VLMAKHANTDFPDGKAVDGPVEAQPGRPGRTPPGAGPVPVKWPFGHQLP